MDIKNYCLAERCYKDYSFFENLFKIARTREVIFLCVGSSKQWFDSFGPMFGSLLRYLSIENFIYGNLAANIKADNISEYVEMIYKFHANPYVVVIDNCLSNDRKGIMIGEGGITCAAYSSSPIEVGDAHICYSVSKKDIKNGEGYFQMLKEIKRIAKMLIVAYNNCKIKL